MNPRTPSGSHRVATDETREFGLLWEALGKQEKVMSELQKDLVEAKTHIAVLQLKASLWTIIGAFIATAMWFVKDLLSRRQ